MHSQYSERLITRFWSHVQKSDGCWLWTGYTGGQNHYGQFHADGHGGKNLYAHRVSWELHFGQLGPDEIVCHHCDTPLCVRPDHLFKGTHADNVRDKVSKGRQLAGEQMPTHLLTEGEVREIHRLYAAGMTQRALADRFSVTRGCITDIVFGKSWKSLAVSHPRRQPGPKPRQLA